MLAESPESVTSDDASNVVSMTLNAEAYKKGQTVPYMTRLREGSLVVQWIVADTDDVATVPYIQE